MKSLSDVFTTLRKKSRGQYFLLFGCLFFSVLLITAYCLMMRSPTVLNVLPVGGDSRKQVMMIFVLAVIGCGAFTLYAAGLFFRHKSREMGVFLALGASRRILAKQLCREIGFISRWFGAVGIILVVLGALLGYFVPSFCVLQMHWYPPEGLTVIFYLPALVGLYMLLLHMVVNGWKKGKSRYSHLIATGMMQFQGRQTVRNMLVITVLVAGAYFAAFYSPCWQLPHSLEL